MKSIYGETLGDAKYHLMVNVSTSTTSVVGSQFVKMPKVEPMVILREDSVVIPKVESVFILEVEPAVMPQVEPVVMPELESPFMAKVEPVIEPQVGTYGHAEIRAYYFKKLF